MVMDKYNQGNHNGIQLLCAGMKNGYGVFFNSPGLDLGQKDIMMTAEDTRADLKYDRAELFYYSIMFTARYKVCSVYQTLYDWSNRDNAYLVISLYLPYWVFPTGKISTALNELLDLYVDKYYDRENGRIGKQRERVNEFLDLVDKIEVKKYEPEFFSRPSEVNAHGIGYIKYKKSELEDYLQNPFSLPDKNLRRVFLISERENRIIPANYVKQLNWAPPSTLFYHPYVHLKHAQDDSNITLAETDYLRMRGDDRELPLFRREDGLPLYDLGTWPVQKQLEVELESKKFEPKSSEKTLRVFYDPNTIEQVFTWDLEEKVVRDFKSPVFGDFSGTEKVDNQEHEGRGMPKVTSAKQDESTWRDPSYSPTKTIKHKVKFKSETGDLIPLEKSWNKSQILLGIEQYEQRIADSLQFLLVELPEGESLTGIKGKIPGYESFIIEEETIEQDTRDTWIYVLSLVKEDPTSGKDATRSHKRKRGLGRFKFPAKKNRVWVFLVVFFMIAMSVLFVLFDWGGDQGTREKFLAEYREKQLSILDTVSENNIKRLENLRFSLDNLAGDIEELKTKKFEDTDFKTQFATEVEGISKRNESLIQRTESLKNIINRNTKSVTDSVEAAFARKDTFNIDDYLNSMSSKILEDDAHEIEEEKIRLYQEGEEKLKSELKASQSAFQIEVNRLNKLLERKTKGPNFESWSSYTSTLDQINKGYAKAVDQKKLEQLRRLRNIVSYYDKYKNAESVSDKVGFTSQAAKIIDTPGLFTTAQKSWLDKKFGRN